MRFLNFSKHQNLKSKPLPATEFVETTKRNKNLWRSFLSVDFHGSKSRKSFPARWMFPDLQLVAHKQINKAKPWLENLDFGRSLGRGTRGGAELRNDEGQDKT